MPFSDVGDNSIGCWRVAIFFGAIFIFCIFVIPWDNEPVPPVATVTPFSVLATVTPALTTVPIAMPQDVTVEVIDALGNRFEPFGDVVVRVSNSALADSGADGQLIVRCLPGQIIMAWAPSQQVGNAACNPGQSSYRITLLPLSAYDNPNYAWASAAGDCNACHGNQFAALQAQSLLPTEQPDTTYNEVNEWLRSGHARVFDSRYFETMYMGTSMSGRRSQPAQPIVMDNSFVPVPPTFDANYHGPGFKLDFPQEPGTCAYCHAPGAVLASQDSANLAGLFPRPAGATGEGVTCDVCHKVYGVILDDRGFPFRNRPGIRSFQFIRPNNSVFMTGPFSNILTTGNLPFNHGSTCAPIFSQSEFCAPCHFGIFGDMVIYNSYGEWRASPYGANPGDAGYRTCQDCHMSHMSVTDASSLSAQRQACSAANTRYQNFDHNMMDYGPPGNATQIPLMIQNAARVDLGFDFRADNPNSFNVFVSVTNTQAGHNFPTDSPLRHLILVVKAVDRVGTNLMQVGGDRIPSWAGPGPGSPVAYEQKLRDTGVLNYSGMPGKVFANLLVEEETNLSPGIAFWNEMKPAAANSDNRLRPQTPDNSIYSFSIPDAGDVTITVELMYRFAFYDLLVQKEWFDRADITVAAWQCQGPPRQPALIHCTNIGPSR